VGRRERCVSVFHDAFTALSRRLCPPVIRNERQVFDFFQNLNMFYGVISECCTQHSCPTMSAGPT
jgi:hypothetical protein